MARTGKRKSGDSTSHRPAKRAASGPVPVTVDSDHDAYDVATKTCIDEPSNERLALTEDAGVASVTDQTSPPSTWTSATSTSPDIKDEESIVDASLRPAAPVIPLDSSSRPVSPVESKPTLSPTLKPSTTARPFAPRKSTQSSMAPTSSAAMSTPTSSSSQAQLHARMERFKSLRLRQQQSAHQNLVDSAEEQRRLATDGSALAALARKHAVASQKLLVIEAAETGEDFERKRAWDWTAEEAAKWDRRMEKKERHRREAGFADYAAEARKTYRRQLHSMPVDKGGYEKAKMQAVEAAVDRGGLDIIETADGEMIAIDKDGQFYSTAEASAGYGDNRPDRAAIDRLVSDIKKAEEDRLKKRRQDRAKVEDDTGEDVTYINLKNKQFNDKLRRFYDKYTVGIRESFERGTAV